MPIISHAGLCRRTLDRVGLRAAGAHLEAVCNEFCNTSVDIENRGKKLTSWLYSLPSEPTHKTGTFCSDA
jgi:hypothetical protein